MKQNVFRHGFIGKQDFTKTSLCDGIPWATHVHLSLSILKRIANIAVWFAADVSKRKQPFTQIHLPDPFLHIFTEDSVCAGHTCSSFYSQSARQEGDRHRKLCAKRTEALGSCPWRGKMTQSENGLWSLVILSDSQVCRSTTDLVKFLNVSGPLCLHVNFKYSSLTCREN